jgi:hypothetical protein
VREPEVLAQAGPDLHVEVVEGDHAVDLARPHQERDAVEEGAAVVEVLDREHVVARVAGPRLLRPTRR